MELDQTSRIRFQNDAFRQHPEMAIPYGIRGQTVITRGVAEIKTRPDDAILILVRTYNEFTEDNDPYGEHDFGAFEYLGRKFFWKIDYFADETCEFGSENPADPEQTFRVLTIMLAEEY